jgi:hypothetical protein
VSCWFAERERRTKDFMDRMRKQQGLLRKVVEPPPDNLANGDPTT